MTTSVDIDDAAFSYVISLSSFSSCELSKVSCISLVELNLFWS